MQSKPAIKPLSSLPVPTIVPTQFSARFNNGLATHEAGISAAAEKQVPTSPPTSQSSRRTSHKDVDARCKAPDTPLQLSSPPGSQQGNDEVADEERNAYGRITSTGKDEAADTLLRLMRAANATAGGVGMCGV